MAKITVVGSLNSDLSICTTQLPKMGETVVGSDFQMLPGGKGLNQATAAAKLGSDVAMIGAVGND
ncbi:MAG: PfkB family carbohydrate kinase, partial [Shewanella sp.]